MPLEDLTVIDIMMTSEQGKPVLCMTDSGVTSYPEKRNELFQQKLKLYVAAIVDGDLADEFPGAVPNDFEIRVICAHQPTPEMLAVQAVAPRGDHANTIRVEFEIFSPHGSQPQRIERTSIETPEVSDELMKLIDFVLTMGLESLKSGGDASCAAVLGEEGVSLVVLAGIEDAREAAKHYASELGPEVKAFAVGFEAQMGVGSTNTVPAVIVEAHERGMEGGVVCGQRFQPKRFLKKFSVEGERVFLGRCNSYLL